MNEMNGYDVEDLRPGMRATFSKTITEADIVLFAAVSGDNNALHVNEEFAATTRFGGRIAHGFLTASVISAAVANRLPGSGHDLPQPAAQLPRAGAHRPDGARQRERQCDRPRAPPRHARHGVPRRRDGGDRRRGAGDDHLVREAPAGSETAEKAPALSLV